MMENIHMMYLRPGNLFKYFTIEPLTTSVLENGRAVPRYEVGAGKFLRGCLADATTDEAARFKQLGHPVTHTIVQRGRPRAKPDDRLHLNGRTFLIIAADEAGSLGMCTIYYVEERTDIV